MKVFVFLVCLLAIFTPNVSACSCAGGGTPCHDYWTASAVFIGTVVESSTSTYKRGEVDLPRRIVRFNIDQTFRGVKGDQVEVMTGLGDSDCGYGFQLGGRYLVYASEASGKLFTGTCSRTRLVSEADDDLAYFRGLAKAEPGGTLSGDVKRVDRVGTSESAPWEERLRPVADIKVVIEGSSRRIEAITDKQGNYRVSGLAPDTYKVRVELPEGLSIYNPERETKLFDRGCAQISFWVETDTRIMGKVFDAQGEPAADVLLELAPVDGQRTEWTSVRTDTEGRYEVKLLRPGRYLFGVRIYGLAGSTYVPYPRTYYPGVSDAARATTITLVEGQRLELSDFILPTRFVERMLTGIVVDADGQPVSGATVWLKENEYSHRDMPYRNETDSEGRFSFKVYEGVKYQLRTYVDISNSKRKEAEQSIRIDADPQVVKLVLK